MANKIITPKSSYEQVRNNKFSSLFPITYPPHPYGVAVGDAVGDAVGAGLEAAALLISSLY